eukprot:521625_1
MSLKEAIQFSHLITQLSHEERITFFSQLMESHTSINSVLTTALFNAIRDLEEIDARDVNKSLSDIIQARTSAPPTSVCTRNIQLHKLPRDLIQYTASFLDQWDYFDFSFCNKAIYLGCNLSHSLEELNLQFMNNYSSRNLSTFQSIKKLTIETNKAIQLEPFDTPNFGQVSALILEGDLRGRGRVQQFLARNILNCDVVTSLKCDTFTNEELLCLFTAFPNVRYLKLSHVRDTSPYRRVRLAQDIYDLYPNLTGLNLEWNRFDPQIFAFDTDMIQLFASKLTHLSFAQRSEDCSFDALRFDKLQELTVNNPSKAALDGILRTATDLKKIAVRTFVHEYQGRSGLSFMNTEQMRNTATNIVLKCPSIKYMCFVITIGDFCSILAGIECGLSGIRSRDKNELKIEICLKGANKENTKDFALNVGRVINALELSSIDDFMFILYFKGRKSDGLWQGIYNSLCIGSQHTKVMRYEHKIVITNQNCKINGYRDTVCDRYVPESLVGNNQR